MSGHERQLDIEKHDHRHRVFAAIEIFARAGKVIDGGRPRVGHKHLVCDTRGVQGVLHQEDVIFVVFDQQNSVGHWATLRLQNALRFSRVRQPDRAVSAKKFLPHKHY